MNNSAEYDLPCPAAPKYQLVEIDSLVLAVPQARVAAVVAWGEQTPLPFAPNSVEGIVCIDGRMFTVINALMLLKAAESAGTATRRLLVALTGAEQLALAADRVKEVIEAETGDINAPEESASSLISGILEKDGQRILVLDVDQLFPSAIRGRERRRRRT